MDDYKEYLMGLTVSDLKDIIRRYNLTTKIKMTGVKKIDLIKSLHTHTHMKKGKIQVKDDLISTLKIQKKPLTEKQVAAQKVRTKKAFERLKEKTRHLFFDDVKEPENSALRSAEGVKKLKKGDMKAAMDELKKLLDED